MDSVLLDTSFCIRLLKEDDDLHQNVVDYFRHSLEQKIEMYLSTIVVAEYSVKDDAQNLPLQTMKIAPFDFADGQTAGRFYEAIRKNTQGRPDAERLVIKDDCKLIAQLYNRKIDGYVTKDRKSFSQIIAPIIAGHPFELIVIDLATPLSEFKCELF